jgi:hypothetical protein
MARQNLGMLVEGGRPTAAASDNTRWGLTLHGAPGVWRTAIGVDSRGNLLYLAVSDVTAEQLAQACAQAGVVNGMELDINPEWPIFVTYGGPGASSPTLEVPNPNQVPNRFLYSSTKDFFALYLRPSGPLRIPW